MFFIDVMFATPSISYGGSWNTKGDKHYPKKCLIVFFFFVSMALPHMCPSLRDISYQLSSHPMTFV